MSVVGTSERPRLCVYRSLDHIYAQVIDDRAGKTIASASSNDGKTKGSVNGGGNVSAAKVVSKAIADPVASRLERVFGISQVKIDPTFTSGSDLPQARVTLQQQVATNVVFTYTTALQDPNTQIVRIEWAMNRRWSAVANRDENGYFSLNFMYKRQFR